MKLITTTTRKNFPSNYLNHFIELTVGNTDVYGNS